MIRLDQPQKTCCLIVGMHNSGTSLVGGLLHAAGMPMGDQLLMRNSIAEEKRPSYDYFEDKEIVSLQDQSLLHTKTHWSSYRSSFAFTKQNEGELKRFRNDLNL